MTIIIIIYESAIKRHFVDQYCTTEELDRVAKKYWLYYDNNNLLTKASLNFHLFFTYISTCGIVQRFIYIQIQYTYTCHIYIYIYTVYIHI